MRRAFFRFTIRHLMIAVALVATVTWLVSNVYLGPKDAADWARHEAAGVGRGRDSPTNRARVARYLTLARGFQRVNAPYQEEAYYHGPFTDILKAGQQVVTQVEAPTQECGPIAVGTVGIVIRDWAGDVDACEDYRRIEIQIIGGPHRGQTAGIERIYLRRGP